MVNNTVKTSRPSTRPSVVEVKKHSSKIEQIFVVVTDVEGGEGIYSVYGSSGQTLPVVAVDEKDVAKLAEYAREQVRRTGRTVSIIGFTNRFLHETFRAPTTGDKK